MPVAGVPQGGINYYNPGSSSMPWLQQIRDRMRKPNAVQDQYKLYGSAVKQQAGDYDDIMGRFRSLYGNLSNPNAQDRQPFDWKPYSPDLDSYSKTADATAAIANLRNLTETGGLSDADQSNLRARGISPIRAVYANEQRNLDRRRSIGGGYSPNYGAVTAKMTRDMSDQVSNATQKVNADIAEAVQRGKLSAAPQYADATAREDAMMRRVNELNTDRKNTAKRDNMMGMLEAWKSNRQDSRDRSGDLQSILNSMTNLYGTTPALSNLYGNQAQDSRNFSANQNQQRRSQAANVFGRLLRR